VRTPTTGIIDKEIIISYPDLQVGDKT